MSTKQASKLLTKDIRSRIKEIRKMRFGDIQQHPTNPKSHPDFQRKIFRESVAFVGFGSIPLAYYSQRNNGKLTWVDGNLRGDELPDYVGEVAILDINDEEAAFLLATLDPIAALAQTNADRLAETLQSVNTNSEILNEFLEKYKQDASEFLEQYDQDTEEASSDVSDGSLLELVKVTIDDPRHVVKPGDVWRVGRHVLLCVDVITDWQVWVDHLQANAPNSVFLPYPGPFASITREAQDQIFVMVQPDPYIAGHILDRHADLLGEDEVRRYG